MTAIFKRLDEAGDGNDGWIDVEIDGQPVRALKGDSVAATLLAAGMRACRETPVSGAPRAPYCMMGVCFECLVEIDGVPNRQSCQIPVQQDMQIRRQIAAGKGYD